MSIYPEYQEPEKKPDQPIDYDKLFKNLGINDVPEEVVLIELPEHKRFLCWDINSTRGLTAFTSEKLASDYLDFCPDMNNTRILTVPFDEAIDIAQRRSQITALHIVDSPSHSVIHYVQ